MIGLNLLDAFSIIIPVFNEVESVEKALEETNMVVSDFECEIIVVDDGSSDGTLNLIENYPVEVIKHQRNRGYGAALKTGIHHAKYDLICIIDADGTYPAQRIPDLVQTLVKGNFDMVVGARTGENVNVPLIRRPAKWVINILANYLCDFKIPDVNSGLRVMKREAVEKFMRILPDGFSFTSTITIAMLTNGHSVEYLPLNYFFRIGRSKIRPIKDTFNFIQLIIRTALYFNPLKVFIPLSLFLVLLAFIVLFGSFLFLGRAMDVTFGVILMTGVLVLAIGMLADLIDKRIN